MDIGGEFLEWNVLEELGMALEHSEIALDAAVALEEAREALFRLRGVADENLADEVADLVLAAAEGL